MHFSYISILTYPIFSYYIYIWSTNQNLYILHIYIDFFLPVDFFCISILIYSIFFYYIYIWPTYWVGSNFFYLNLIRRIKSEIWSKKIKFDPRIKIWSSWIKFDLILKIWSWFDPRIRFDPDLIQKIKFDLILRIWSGGSNLIFWIKFSLIWSWSDPE